MRIKILIFTILAFALPANAFSFEGVEDRAQAVRAQLEGNESYDAHLARKLASIANSEKAQHDLAAARQFIRMAEEHAAKATGGGQ